ncbi:MAG TPA: hypothetical protein PKX00_20660, partial [Opitutaceae bacterium]|nr:hypothetical protein [Opitutaceae bacterium]
MSRSFPRTSLVAAVLLLAVFALYGRIAHHQPIAFDDALYVTQNTWVLQGLTWKGAFWAFTNTDAANWHPLTWLSHMADQSLFSGRPGAQMIENAFWHALNSLLVFLVLARLGLSRSVAAVLALVFAVHPANVESVAWLSQRKTQLSTCFLLVTVLLYLRPSNEGSTARRDALIAFTFALSLMAKASGVVLPAILLVHEFLLRSSTPGAPWQPWGRQVLRRIGPLALVGLAGAVITFLAQQGQGAVASIDALTLPHRLANAGAAVATYLQTFAWPGDLCLFY